MRSNPVNIVNRESYLVNYLFTTMLSPKLIVGSLAFLALAAAQESTTCPELPETGVTMGEPVPMHPEHIPAGCSDFEILVGECR